MVNKENIYEFFERGDDAQFEFMTTQSDRACVVVAGAYIDDLLSMLLETYFVKPLDTSDDILSGSGPLATFAAKNQLAYRLGLISQEEFRMIDCIRKIRNQFAHNPTASSLDGDTRVYDLLSPLIPNEKLWFIFKYHNLDEQFDRLFATMNKSKVALAKILIWLSNVLLIRTVNAGLNCRHPPLTFYYAFEIYNFLIDSRQSWIDHYRPHAERAEAMLQGLDESSNEDIWQREQDKVDRIFSDIANEEIKIQKENHIRDEISSMMDQEGLLDEINPQK